MLWTLVVLLAGACSADYSARCSQVDAEAKTSLSVTAAEDIAGRYIIEYCTAVEPGVSKWLLLMSNVSQPKQNCTYRKLKERFSGSSHSYSQEFIDLSSLNITCPRVCFSKSMDLMFRACYRLQNMLHYGDRTQESFNEYFFADNNITASMYTNDSSQFFNSIDHTTTVSVDWFEGRIPILDYEIAVWPNDTHSEELLTVTSNCTKRVKSVQCMLSLPVGCYVIQLTHKAPWTTGFHDLSYHYGDFCHTGLPGPEVRKELNLWAWVAAIVALFLLTVASIALAMKLKYIGKTRFGRRVKDFWIEMSSSRQDREKAEVTANCGRILLIYARDCAPAMRVARALSSLLHAGQGQVYELYCPEVTAQAARAPAAWLREVFFAADVKIVLLQTPALAALHTVQLADGTLKLEEPLLGRRAAYRRPVFGDALLRLALQLLGEAALAQPHPPYKKYFLATVSELAVDMFPTVVPYTRYELPGAAAALLHALRPAASASETDIADLTAAAAQLVQHAKENPHYLAEHLVFL